ncbi:MAG: CPBP family intramembrane glutamic endopeptidase [Elusimicrobiota bacterium]
MTGAIPGADHENALPRRAISRYGRIRYWAVSAVFCVLYLARVPLLDKFMPLEARLARFLSFSDLAYHQNIFYQWSFELLALGLAWAVIKSLKLTDEETGWVRPEDPARAVQRPALMAALFWVLISVAYFYGWMIFNDISAKHFSNPYTFLWAWPEYSYIKFNEAFSHFGVRALVSLAGTVLLAPVVEEVLIRGVFFAVFSRRFSILMVIFLTTLLHVLAHYNSGNTFSFFGPWAPHDSVFFSDLSQLALFSVIAGWLRFRYKSLWAPAAFHSCFNLLGWTMCWKICAPR